MPSSLYFERECDELAVGPYSLEAITCNSCVAIDSMVKGSLALTCRVHKDTEMAQ